MIRRLGYFSLCVAAAISTAAFFASHQAAHAADKKVVLPVENAMATAVAKIKLDGSVDFYFGSSPHPAVTQQLGAVRTKKKTNAFGKSDDDTCNHVLISALINLQNQAVAAGGDAVVNIRSTGASGTAHHGDAFECYVGFLMSSVALEGDAVKLDR